LSEPLSCLAVGDWITVAARKWPAAPCLVRPETDGADGRRSLSFAETNDRVTRVADSRLAHGLRSGTRVAVIATDSFEHIEIVLACLKAGVTFCDLNYRLRTSELANILSRCPMDAVFFSGRYGDIVDEIGAGGVEVGWRCRLDDDGGPTEFEDLIAGGQRGTVRPRAG
jgi:fatty-acyl-CoA synthase